MKSNISFILLPFCLLFTAGLLHAQQQPVKRSSEELRELFGYCEKPELVQLVKISAEQADKIGDIDQWARQQQASIDANTNEVFATKGELMQEVNKKYKALGLSADQIKAIGEYRKKQEDNPAPCALISLQPEPAYDTLTQQRAVQLYKTKYRKQLIDKLGINGRQADFLIETEIWQQKETRTIASIPETDFNRIRKTVAMHTERKKRIKAIVETDNLTDAAYAFFDQHRL